MRNRFFLLLSLFLSTHCFGTSTNVSSQGPWWTGPLLTPAAQVIPPGHFNIQPYFFWTVTNGFYNKNWRVVSIPKFHQLNPQVPIKIGIFDRIALTGNIQAYYNRTRGTSSSAFGDLSLGIDYQVFAGEKHDLVDFIKFNIQETFPTGKYQKLNPKKFGTDSGGLGSWATQVSLTASKVYQVCDENYFRWRCSLLSTFFAPVRVKGANTFGGDPSTRGTVYPGRNLTFLVAAEYSLTHNWVLALDLAASFSTRKRFSGHTFIPVGGPSSVQYSAAPAIEYNWNEAWGLIVGSWFTFAGRNSSRFVSTVAALNYVY